MRRLGLFSALAAIAWTVCMSAGVHPAFAATDVSVGFGATYTAPDGATCTHRGVDVPMAPGSRVEAPAHGTVRFAGRVPGPHGDSVLAVSLATQHGTVSLLPLAEVRVRKGDEIEQGDALGTLAESGDPSTAGPHLHVGLRRDDLYIDPSVLLHAEQPAAPPAPVAPPAPTPSPDGVEPAPSPTRPGPATAPAAQTAGGRAGSAARSPSTSIASAGELAAASAGLSIDALGQGVSLAPAPGGATVRVAPAGAGAGSAAGSPPTLAATADVAASERLLALAEVAVARMGGWLRAAGPLGFAGIVTAFAACALLLGRRALEARVTSNPPVSDRWGKLLRQLRAGDTLRGLTSCSGPLPSQSRGRLAQRR